MTVALDATPLLMTSGGLRRYVEELSSALAFAFPSDTFRLVTDQRIRWTATAPNLVIDEALPQNWLNKRWWLFGIQPRLKNVDVFHGTSFFVPYIPSLPTVLTLHDLSPWKDPAWHSGATRTRIRTPILIRLGLATMLITPTETVRREAIAEFGLPPDRIVAVPEAASAQFKPCRPCSGSDYFLCVGTVEPRKRIPWLLECWREVYRLRGVKLVLVGRHREDAPVIQAEPGLEILGEVPDSLLPPLYSGAIASLYPSAYEGFGLPVLEAMQCGAPVIASPAAALRETAGSAAIFAADQRSMIEAMRSLATSRELRAYWQNLGFQRAREFSWERTAQLTREVYMEAIRRFGA